MLSALLRKSITDLTRRKARTLFTVSTLALAVASISILAVPALIDRAMQAEVRSERLAHVTLNMRPLRLSDAQLSSLAALPNVKAVEARSELETRIYVGERRAAALVIGVCDFSRQSVDVVRLTSGARPRHVNDVLVDVQDENQGTYGGRTGDSVRILGAGGKETRLLISGEARNIDGGQLVAGDDIVVLYATTETVEALTGARGYDRLAFRLADTSPAALSATLETLQKSLRGLPGFSGFSNLPEVRAAGDWPGEEDSETFVEFFGVITLLALLSALVLISNTMTTLVSEQTGEIGIMRAVGARRRQITMVYVKTSLLLGALGTLVGLALGLVLSNLIAGFFGSTFFAVDVGFGADTTVLFVGVVVGVLAPPLAALPAIRRGTRIDLREALVDGTANALEDRRRVRGYETGGEITYVEERNEISSYRTLTTSIAVLGFLVVAISMVGLANAITMSIIERTCEISPLHRRPRPRRSPHLRH